MTSSPQQCGELTSALEACLALPDISELLDPPLLLSAHALLESLKTTPQDAAAFTQISLFAETSSAAVLRRHVKLRHEQDTLTRMIGKNQEVADRLELNLQPDQHQSQETWKSFNIARKLIVRQGGMLLNHLDRERIEQLVAKNRNEILKSPTTGALAQAMQNLTGDASTLLEGFERQHRQIMNVIEAVFTRLNQLPGFKLAPPQLSGMKIYRHNLDQLGEKAAEFCCRPINLMTDKASLAKKFGIEIVEPVRNLFTQLNEETDWWLSVLLVPVQEQIQTQKNALEKRESDLGMIRNQITLLQSRLQETEIALTRLEPQEMANERIFALTRTL